MPLSYRLYQFIIKATLGVQGEEGVSVAKLRAHRRTRNATTWCKDKGLVVAQSKTGFSLVLMGVILAIVYGLLSPYYLTNDDIAMRMMAEGGFAKAMGPSPYLVFMHLALGKLLALLYGHFPTVYWYDSLLLSVSCIASGVILFVIYPPQKQYAFLIYPLFFALAILTKIFLGVQYSLVAMLIAASGVALLLHVYLNPVHSRQRTLWVFCYAIGAILSGGMLRYAAVVLLLLFACTACLPLVYGKPFSLRKLAVLSVFMVSAAGGFLLYIWEVNEYRHTPGWEQFYASNTYRVWISEYNDLFTFDAGAIPKNDKASLENHQKSIEKKMLTPIGWSINDYTMLKSWFYVNPALYSLEKLEALYTHMYQHKVQQFYKRFLRNADRVLLTRPYILFALVILLVGITFFTLKAFLYSGYVAANYAAFLMLMDIFLKTPPFRFYFGLFFFAFLLVVLAGYSDAGKEEEGKRDRLATIITKTLLYYSIGYGVFKLFVLWKPDVFMLYPADYFMYNAFIAFWILSMVTLGVVIRYRFASSPAIWPVQFNRNVIISIIGIYIAGTSLHQWYQREQLKVQVSQDVQHIKNKHNNIWVVWGGGFPYEAWLFPFKQVAPSHHMEFISLGWPNLTPYIQDTLRYYHIEDLAKAACTRADIFMFMPEGIEKYLQRYVKEHFAMQAKVVPVYQGESFLVNQCVSIQG